MIFLPMERRGLHPSKTQSKQPSALRTNSLTGFDLGDPACAAKSAPTCEDQHTRLGMFLLFLQIFIELAKLGSDRVSRRRRGPGTHNGRSRTTASPPGLQRLSLLCRMVIKQDSGANIFPAEKRSQIHRCFLALAAVQAQQILHVQVLQSVSECTQDGGKVCGKSGGSAAVEEEKMVGWNPTICARLLIGRRKRCMSSLSDCFMLILFASLHLKDKETLKSRNCFSQSSVKLPFVKSQKGAGS